MQTNAGQDVIEKFPVVALPVLLPDNIVELEEVYVLNEVTEEMDEAIDVVCPVEELRPVLAD